MNARVLDAEEGAKIADGQSCLATSHAKPVEGGAM